MSLYCHWRSRLYWTTALLRRDHGECERRDCVTSGLGKTLILFVHLPWISNFGSGKRSGRLERENEKIRS